ncbi:MAG: hypothetical protein H6702_14515 [Myxococcales bacterium]|nr:hypothetical protein [Myxococcales bacterium]
MARRLSALWLALWALSACEATDLAPDAAATADGAAQADGAAADSGTPADGGPPGDARPAPDGALSPDGAVGPDAGPSPEAGPSPDAGPNPDGGSPPDQGVACDPPAVLAAHGCANAGCHAPPVAGGLDLVAPDPAPRLVGAPAVTGGCQGRLVIDPQRPERSLMLQAIGAAQAPGGAEDACQLVMPPQGGMPAADQACLTTWVHDLIAQAGPVDPVDPFDPTPVAGAVAKVKTLLTGLAPTSEEIAAVQADPAALRGLVQGWTETPEFQVKLADFLTVALQQRLQAEDIEQFDRLQRHRSRNALFRKVMEESFVRTALDLIERGQPFTQVLTTRTWMVTTANLVLLRYPDQPTADKRLRHTLVGDAADAPPGLAGQVRQRRWYLEAIAGMTCDISQADALDMLFGFINRRRCDPEPERNVLFDSPPLTEADFADWRLVELVPANEAAEGDVPVAFYDLPTLRRAERLVTGLHRTGFFTTSVFLNNWPSNADNQFRVTTNQTVLGALHAGFVASEPTEPLHTDGVDPAHADPETACYGCHRQLDPMRNYFAQSYGFDYQTPAPNGPEAQVFDPADRGGFAFLGVTAQNGDLDRLANTLARHPRFPVAWTQKLCLYANASRCDEADPAFTAIAARFADGFDFQGLVVDLFSSPLVTGLEETETWAQAEVPVGITRRNHLCALLDARLGRQGLCQNARVARVVGLIPGDDFARGAADFTQPNRPSAFQFAAAEAVCEAAGLVVITGANEEFPVRDVPTAIEAIVTRLMGLPAEHPRHAGAVAALSAHHAEALALGQNVNQALRAAFTLACLSPDVQGVGL